MKILTAAWRSNPPTLDEVRDGSSWWWYRQRGEDGYTAPHVLEIGWDDDGLFFVEPDCPRVTPEEYGDGVEWWPLYPPEIENAAEETAQPTPVVPTVGIGPADTAVIVEALDAYAKTWTHTRKERDAIERILAALTGKVPS